MQMLQSISKSLAALVVGVVLSGCHSNAQTAQSVEPLSEYHGLYTPSNTEEFQNIHAHQSSRLRLGSVGA